MPLDLCVLCQGAPIPNWPGALIPACEAHAAWSFRVGRRLSDEDVRPVALTDLYG